VSSVAEKCFACGGSGEYDNFAPCHACGGTGERPSRKQKVFGAKRGPKNSTPPIKASIVGRPDVEGMEERLRDLVAGLTYHESLELITYIKELEAK